jgi:tRNA (adenine37-N6)-methyltransferase
MVSNSHACVDAADVIDGSPILDIKPYLPFCESMVGAAAPDWVQASLDLFSARES